MSEGKHLEIRHRVAARGSVYVVIENFGDQPAIEFTCLTLEEAKTLVASRKALLLEMVASISDEARAAVDDARHINNLKAGHG